MLKRFRVYVLVYYGSRLGFGFLLACLKRFRA